MDNNYNSYTIDELIQDQDFCNWVLKGVDKEAWNEWTLSQSDTKQIEINKAKALVGGLGSNNKSAEMDVLLKNKLWDRINTTIQSKEVSKPKSNIVRMAAIVSAIAASLAILIILRPTSSTTMEVYAEINQQIELPQSSTVELSKDAKVTYDTKGWEQERELTLEGEAFFDVTKGQPFVVKTNHGEVSVLGTSFNVDSGADHLYVDVRTGKVKVATTTKVEVLSPGDSYYLNPAPSELGDKGAGITHYVFENQEVSEIFKVLEYRYKVEIDISAIDYSSKATTYFNSSDDLKVALEKVIFPLNLKFSIDNNRVVIY